GIKVGLYYSPPNWYFERDTKNFSRVKDHNVGPDGKERTTKPTPEQLAAQKKAYIELVRGQIKELLTRYGKIDLLWFDGRIPGTSGDEVMSLDEMRKLQPGVVIDGRMNGHGDFLTYERKLGTTKPVTGWAELCNPWTSAWPYVIGNKSRANGFILGQFVLCRSLKVNYLLDIGPKPDGTLQDETYSNMTIVANWMKANSESIKGTTPLPAGESASVPATASGHVRYLFAMPKFKTASGNDFAAGSAYPEDQLPSPDATLTFSGKLGTPADVKLLGDGSSLEYSVSNNIVSVQLPASKRTKLVDVVKVEF
ncbi:MAG TPA: alpha-L-fucosidase, partial [Candidatus Baltobacteraceae bacterium]|nr:alpha-L-fucosidase [Candidatus Baltobacteraceae bacterium]